MHFQCLSHHSTAVVHEDTHIDSLAAAVDVAVDVHVGVAVVDFVRTVCSVVDAVDAVVDNADVFDRISDAVVHAVVVVDCYVAIWCVSLNVIVTYH